MNILIEGYVEPDNRLGTIVGYKPTRRTDLNRALWEYIRAHTTKDKADPLGLRTNDPKLTSILGKHFQTFDVGRAIEKHVNASVDVAEDIQQLDADPTLTKTEKKQLINARLGQGQFRSRLINYWKACAATDCTTIDLLKASHIKPWSKSTNSERLDPFNGLLLIPNLDAAFDGGLITFDSSGKINISSILSKSDARVLGIKSSIVIKLGVKHQKYMEYHREMVFIS